MVVVALPGGQVGAARVADPVAELFASEVAAVPVAEEHVVDAVAQQYVRTGLRLVGLDAALDEVLALLRPRDPVGRRRHADLVDGLGPAVDDLPASPGDVEQLPRLAEPADLRAAHDEPLLRRARAAQAPTGPLPRARGGSYRPPRA